MFLMRRLISWSCIITCVLIFCAFHLGRSVAARHAVVEVPASPGDPAGPVWPLSGCNGEELISQSDEQYVLRILLNLCTVTPPAV